jgi:hypothetical protein
MMNDFSNISAENESRFAAMTPEDLAGYDEWLAERANEWENWRGDSDGTVGVD